jgi:hypothetical protein
MQIIKKLQCFPSSTPKRETIRKCTSMKRNLVGSIVYWTPTILTGLLLAYCISASNAENQISSAPLSSPANGTVYYVAVNEPGASDGNNGLSPTYQGGQNGPWLTIQHAANTMLAGGTTYVRAGTYYESGIIFAHSGAPGAPITLANYQCLHPTRLRRTKSAVARAL